MGCCDFDCVRGAQVSVLAGIAAAAAAAAVLCIKYGVVLM